MRPKIRAIIRFVPHFHAHLTPPRSGALLQMEQNFEFEQFFTETETGKGPMNRNNLI